MAGEYKKNFRLSSRANEIAERIKEEGHFENVLTVARFGMAYALKNHFEEISPDIYRMPDSAGSNYNIGNLDSDGQLRALLVALYPGTTTPYLFAQHQIAFGLLRLGERIDNEGWKSVSDLL